MDLSRSIAVDLSPDAQHLFAKQINATVLSINSSHASPLSHPNEVAQLILNATSAGSDGNK
jgi:hypothetical protein